MVDVKNIVIPIAGLVIALVLGGSGIVDLINSYFYKPSVFIAVVPDNKTTNSTTTIDITNKGSAPATHLKLTLSAPGKIDDYDVNSTEDYQEVYAQNSTSLVLNIPRFIHGEGSLIKLNLKLENISSSGSDNYVAYATYDQGSLKVDVPAIQYEPRLKIPLSIQGQITVFWNNWGTGIILIISAVIAGVSGLIVDRLYKRHRVAELVRVSPEDGSRNVPFDTFITVTFDKPIDRSTMNTVEFTVKRAAGKDITHQGQVTVTQGGRTISFEPEGYLVTNTTYLATISGEIKPVHGSKRHVSHTWSFTTGMGKNYEKTA